MRHEVSVKFVRRLYGTEDGDYSVFAAELVNFEDTRKIRVNKRYGNFSIAGDFSLENSEIGSVYTVTIEEDLGAKYPNSYKLIKLHYDLPKDSSAQWDYLENSNIVSYNNFLAIRRTFKEEDKILDIMMDNPELLTKVKGIGQNRAELYQKRLLENKDKALIFSEYGDIEGVGSKVIKYLVDWKPSVKDVIKSIKKDPFSLLESPNIGFMLADRFRAHYNLPLNDRNRILHGVSYFLSERFQDSGDTYSNIFEMAKSISRKLFVSYEEIVVLLSEIQQDKEALDKYKLKIFGKNITTKDLFDAELLIYQQVNSMMRDKKHIVEHSKWEEAKENLLSNTPQELAEEQNNFLDLINDERVTILLGPGGSGKSWVINLACQLIKSVGKTYALYAPTARAAHVMSGYVGSEASTIHRGLMSYASIKEVVPYDVLIVDEFSMVDSELTSVILKTMGTNTRLIIVGDDFQLQSVGPGNVLFDLVESIKVPTVKFTKVFRQNEGSKITDYANELREGAFYLPPDAKKVENEDIVFINESNDERQKEIALSLYKKAYDKYGVDDIMLLSPTNKGVSGRSALNKMVQEIVNNSKTEDDVIFGGGLSKEENKTYFKKDDYISVKKNNYDMESDRGKITKIINGDLGYIERVRKNNLTFKVNRHSYTIDKSEVKELIDHAWSITIHKSQGGQANEVIIVLPKNSYFMLNANMLYTAITRAKIKCYVIGDFSGINSSAKEQANFSRKTMIQLQSIAHKKVKENKEKNKKDKIEKKEK